MQAGKELKQCLQAWAYNMSHEGTALPHWCQNPRGQRGSTYVQGVHKYSQDREHGVKIFSSHFVTCHYNLGSV